ncbi:GtrA family protein [Streptomyces griseoviridis]|uniref:GtrA family protein n=1 Tax=Streptomyces griseoviridis TaxID=45398 RepID=UPI0033C2FF73
MTEQFVTSVLIGYVNTGAYQAVDVALNSRIPYLAAHVVAFAVSIVGSFVLNSYPTCRTRRPGALFSAIRYPLSAIRYPLSAIRYPLSSAFHLAASGTLLYLAVSRLEMNENAAALVTGALITPISFYVVRTLGTPERR